MDTPKPTVLIVGATGATGRLLAQELLDRNYWVRVMVRSRERLPEGIRGHPHLLVTEANLLDVESVKLIELVAGCSAVASCLGHNLSVRGIFGPPHRLVASATRRLCSAMMKSCPAVPVKFLLMNTAGVTNRGVLEPVSSAQRCVVGILRILLPPHADNEDAAEYLRVSIGPMNPRIEWSVIRPDTLSNADGNAYEVHPSPIRSAIFDPGKTSRANVACFMSDLIEDSFLWEKWKSKFPVIYDAPSPVGNKALEVTT